MNLMQIDTFSARARMRWLVILIRCGSANMTNINWSVILQQNKREMKENKFLNILHAPNEIFIAILTQINVYVSCNSIH